MPSPALVSEPAPMPPLLRSWRTRVFAATWLSYVGFYFCRKPFSAAKSAIAAEGGFDATTLGQLWAVYLVTYAGGQFLAGAVGTRLGPRVSVLTGMAVSVLATLCMGVTLSVPLLAGLLAINGLAQATGWSGNVGTMAAWFHRRERGAVMGAWATNFTVGSLSSAWVLAWVLAQRDEGAPPPWRLTMVAGAAVLAVVWVVFWFFQRNRPEDVGLSPVEEPEHGAAAGDADSGDDGSIVPTGAPRAFWTTLVLIGGFYFFAKLVRYAIWSWAAFFLERNYALSGAEANVYATTFDLMGIPGVWVTGWLSDRYFGSRRGVVAFGMMLGMTAACGALMLLGHTGVTVFAALLGVVGFTLYGPDALLTGAGAIDAGDRRTATFAAATISGLGSLGPIVQELVIGRLYDTRGGDLAPIFALLFGSAACAAAFCAALAWRERQVAGDTITAG